MIKELQNKKLNILVVGNHAKIIQSILDFDYASGKKEPSVSGIISGNRKSQKLFWGNNEYLLPVFKTMQDANNAGVRADFLFNITSAGSAPDMVNSFFKSYPEAYGAHVFAENVAERDALALIESYGAGSKNQKFVAGPSGVGFCVPWVLKLGAIGGISGPQVAELGKVRGSTAIICSSGGMVNELMYQVMKCGSGVSFAVSYGGDRFPITSSLEWVLEAEADPNTKEIVFFGELGGSDEYAIRDAIKDNRITKPMFAYIAGHYDSKDAKIQFGHAKALANEESETAQAKMEALDEVGVKVAKTFQDFMNDFSGLSKEISVNRDARVDMGDKERMPTYFSSPKDVKNIAANSFTEAIVKRILMKEQVSEDLVSFVDLIFRELIDHGPNVSGAVNTIITTRAGRDMESALATGILTIGDRFGGAINNAARVWYQSQDANIQPEELVANYSRERDAIPGIGHLKYSLYNPDPRVTKLTKLSAEHLNQKKYFSYATEVATLTSQKKQNLILNVDGAVSALFLDYLAEKEGFSNNEILELLDIGFFNSLFIIARSVGFIGNHLDQKRIDEGLFRLKDDDIYFF